MVVAYAGDECVELAEPVGDIAVVEPGPQLAQIGVDVVDAADVAVVDLLVVVVLDLHHLVAGREGPAEAFDAPLAGRVQGGLEHQVERTRARGAPVHRAEHLDVADGVEPEAPRDAGLDQLADPLRRRGAVVRRYEVEVALRVFRAAEVRQVALVDAMRGCG